MVVGVLPQHEPLKVASVVVLESLVWTLQGLCGCGKESAFLRRK